MARNRNSRYWRTPRVRRGTDVWYMLQRAPATKAYPDDQFHEVQVGDTLQVLAHTYYGDARLWWVFGYWNGIVDPFVDPEPGSSLRFPSITRLFMSVLS